MPNILLIAAESDLRRSVEFALRADGHQVNCFASIGAHVLPHGFDCTVIDHHAVGKDLTQGMAFCRAFAPTILLANGASHPLSAHAFRTVFKPTLGPALIAAVHDAVTTRGTTTHSP